MSEKQPNPEMQKPAAWYDTCNKCKTKYEITGDNAFYADFTKKPECNFIQCKCTNCGNDTRIYDQDIDPEGANVRNIYIVDEHEYPSDAVYEQWLEVNGYEPPTEYELTDRMDATVKKFGETLSALADQAPELFWDEMNSPQDRPYPGRWI